MLRGEQVYDIKPGAIRAVFFFLMGIIAVVLYAIALIDNVQQIRDPFLPVSQAIVMFMAATFADFLSSFISRFHLKRRLGVMPYYRVTSETMESVCMASATNRAFSSGI